MARRCHCHICARFRSSHPYEDGARWASLDLLQHVAEKQASEENTTILLMANPIDPFADDGSQLRYAFRCRICHRDFSTSQAGAYTMTVPPRPSDPNLFAQFEVCTSIELFKLRWVEDGMAQNQLPGQSGLVPSNFCPDKVARVIWGLQHETGVYLLAIEEEPEEELLQEGDAREGPGKGCR